MENAVSFTGHRPRIGMSFDNRSERTASLEENLSRALELLVREQQVRFFLCGMASGFDLFAAQRVLRMRRSGILPENVGVVAVLPYPNHCWDISGERWKNAYQEVLQCACDQAVVTKEKKKDSFKKRNEYLVQNADILLAYWNHDPRTGTGQTVRMATEAGRSVINLYDLEDFHNVVGSTL